VVPALARLMDCRQALSQVVSVGNDGLLSIRALAELVKRLMNPDAYFSFVSCEEAYSVGFEDLGSHQSYLSHMRQLIGSGGACSTNNNVRGAGTHIGAVPTQ
jgi:hypothetical protein